MTLLRRETSVRTALTLFALLGSSLSAAACSSGSTGDYTSYAGGGPAAKQPAYEGGAGGSSGGSSGAHAGSSSGGSSGGGGSSSSGGGDAGLGNFGDVTATSVTLIDATITTQPAGAAVFGFDPIKFGAQIDLAHVSSQLTMKADPPPVAAIGSIAFALDASYTHVANTMPYSLCGDDGKGKFLPCMLPVGKHTLTITPYPQTNLGGTPYQPTVFEFEVVDSRLDGGIDGGTD
jgi:hypothetical protein